MRPGTVTPARVEELVGNLDELRARVNAAMAYGGSPVQVETADRGAHSPHSSAVSRLPKPDMNVERVVRARGRPRSHTPPVRHIDKDMLKAGQDVAESERAKRTNPAE